MTASVFSPSWHLMAELRPRLLPHSQLLRHTYRGQRWYVIRDTAKGRYHRLSPAAYAFVQCMDGVRTVQQLWDDACNTPQQDVPTQTEVVELLSQLHANDLLQCDVTPDTVELLERYKKQRRSRWLQKVASPLSTRIPLLDPDAFLTRWVDRMRWIFSPYGALLWLVIVFPALLLAARHWEELSGNLSDQLLSSGNLILMGALFIPIKVLHELGHGFATKVWGGSVREMGLMFLVFAPVPYVECSSSAAFESKYRRAIVGAAGMLAELAVAAVAMYVWVIIEPGLLRAAAFNVMLVAGISTVVINGNPLLRYDGYYILCDLIEIPNLGQRGQRYWTYLIDRYLFRVRDIEPTTESPAEKRWIAPYTIVSWCYRVTITIGIILFIAPQFFVFGTILAIWSAATLIVVPLWKGFRHVTSGASLQARRGFAIYTTVTLITLVVAFLTLVPIPLKTQAEGAYWLPDNAMIRAQEDGFVMRWALSPGAHVKKGTPVIVMKNPKLQADLQKARARLAEARARFDAESFTNLAQAEILRQAVTRAEREVEDATLRCARLVVEANHEGWLLVAQPQDMESRHYRKGDLLGYVINPNEAIIRVAVSQDDAYLVRTQLKSVEIRAVDQLGDVWRSAVLREVPGGVDELTIPTLATLGGGKIPVEPQGEDRLKLLNRYFLFDLHVPAQLRRAYVGARVYVRFSHFDEPLMKQWRRQVRQLLMGHLNV